ncbi:MAG: M23 family metallopeptidase [Chlorobi bacterium]|nr:M23 family metallopeptidase [Chlorobiota bacterium]
MTPKVQQFLTTIAVSIMIMLVSFGFRPIIPTVTPTELPLPTAQERLNAFGIFATEVNAVLDRYLSYNTLVEQLEEDSESETTILGGYLDRALRETLLATEMKSTLISESVQSLSILSLELHSTTFPVYQTLFMDEMERVRRGMLIQSLPLTVPIEGATITSKFGIRNHPVLRGRRMHKGLDMAAPRGTPIYTTGGGTVKFSGRKNGYGNSIIVDHDNGYTTLYAHCSQLLVEEGVKVSRGDMIALVGSTGRSTGPHLHYEVRVNDQHMNPEVFLVYRRERIEELKRLSDYYLTF